MVGSLLNLRGCVV